MSFSDAINVRCAVRERQSGQLGDVVRAVGPGNDGCRNGIRAASVDTRWEARHRRDLTIRCDANEPVCSGVYDELAAGLREDVEWIALSADWWPGRDFVVAEVCEGFRLAVGSNPDQSIKEPADIAEVCALVGVILPADRDVHTAASMKGNAVRSLRSRAGHLCGDWSGHRRKPARHDLHFSFPKTSDGAGRSIAECLTKLHPAGSAPAASSLDDIERSLRSECQAARIVEAVHHHADCRRLDEGLLGHARQRDEYKKYEFLHGLPPFLICDQVVGKQRLLPLPRAYFAMIFVLPEIP